MSGMRYQPQAFARIRPHWRRRGLAFAWVASNPSQNIANANAADLRIGKLVYAAGPRGIGASGFQPPSSSNILIQDSRITGFSGTGTFVSGGVYSGSGGMMSIGTSGQGLRIGVNSNSGLTYMGVADYYNGPSPAAGPIVLGVSISPGAALVTLKDVNRIASSTISIGAPAATSEPLRMGTTGVSDVWPGTLEFGFYFTQALTADELRELVNNPWSLFENGEAEYEDIATASATTPSTDNGTLSVTLASIGLSSTGTATVRGTASVALGALATTSAGAVGDAGAVASPLAALTLSASGSVSAAGVLTMTLAPMMAAGAGAAPHAGALSGTLGGLALTAYGAAPASGAFASTLGSVALVGAGAVLARGVAANTLSGLTLAAGGTVGPQQGGAGGDPQAVGYGQFTAQLGSVSLVAAGIAPISGQAGITLGGLQALAGGAALDAGQAGVMLGVLGLQAYGGVPVLGGLTSALGALTLTATAGMFVFTRSPQRTYVIQPEDRRHRIAPENRTYRIEP